MFSHKKTPEVLGQRTLSSDQGFRQCIETRNIYNDSLCLSTFPTKIHFKFFLLALRENFLYE